jgi:hypothetical protein
MKHWSQRVAFILAVWLGVALMATVLRAIHFAFSNL